MDDGLAGLGKRSALALVSAGVSGAATVAILLVVSRTLTTTGAGEFFVAISLFTIVQGICSFGTETGLQYFVPTMAPRAAQHLIRTISIGSTASGVVVGASVWWLAGPIGDMLSESDGAGSADIIRTVAIVLPFAGLYEVTMGGLRARDEVLAAMTIDRVARPIAQITALILVGALAPSSKGAVLAWTLPHIGAVLLAGAFLLRARPERPDKRYDTVSGRAFWAYTGPRSVARIAQTITQRLDVLILAAVYPLEEAGIYGTVSRCMIAGVLVSTALRQTVQPQLRRLVVRGEQRAVKDLFGTSTTWLVLVSWPVYIVMITHAPLVMSVFGDEYRRGASALVLLCLAMLVATACGLVDVVLLMLGKSWLSTVNVVVALVLNVALNLLLAPLWGMIGSAIAWVVAILTTNLLPLWQTARHGLTPAGRPLAAAVAISLGTIAVPMALVRLVFGTQEVPFAIGAAVTVAMYGGALWLFRREVQLDQLVRDLRRPRRRTALN